MNTPVELESTAIVRFQDCDPFGHLNNARYIDYFLNARQDQIAANYGIHLYEKDKPPVESWVVSKTQIAYLAPAKMAEEVIIRTRLIEFDQNRLVVEGVMLDQARQRIKAVVWMDFIYISLLNGRRARHPDNLMELFHQAKLSGVFSEDGFNQRVIELRADQTTFRAEQNVQRAEQSAHRAEQSTQRAEPRELAQA